jgi:arylsulfatase A-like enzyme
MRPLLPVLGCYGLGLVLLLGRGGGRDPLLSSALALPIGAAATAIVMFLVVAMGMPVAAGPVGAAWGAAFLLAARGARHEVRRLWPWPAVVGIGLAILALATAHFDIAVLTGPSHDTLLAARVLASGGEVDPAITGGTGLAVLLHAAVALVSPDRVHAFAPALGLSVLLALVVLVTRVVDHRQRGALAVASALALATSFPVVRALLMVGSPAAAGGLLLAAAGLWCLGEIEGNRPMLPVALLALAGFGLQAPSFALAAALGAAVLAAGARIGRHRIMPRIPAFETRPGLRLAVVAAIAAIVPAVAGHAGAGALAGAPLAILSITVLVAGRAPAVDRVPEVAPRAFITRQDVELLVISWVATGAIVAILECGFLLGRPGHHVGGLGHDARLLALGLGNLLPLGLAAALVLAAAAIAARAASRGWRRGRMVVGAAAGLLSLPYAIWLARYTFSGPQAQTMAYRGALVTLATALVAVGFATAIWFATFRDRNRRFAAAILAALVVASALAVGVSGSVLENEYEPLHQFLALWALLLAALAGREAAHLARARVTARRRLPAAAAIAMVAWSAASGVVLARSQGDAWLVWGESGVSRYLTRRWQFLAPAPEALPGGERMVIRPDLESSRTAALRAARATAPAPNIVLFSIDGLRQDRVGAYGYTRRNLTPNIDRLAARGVRFTRAMSSYPVTQVFNSALLLGRGVDRSGKIQQPPGFRASAITNVLERRGYHSFVKGWFNQFLKKRFDPRPYHIDTYAPKATTGEELEETMEQGLARLATHLEQARASGQPVFVWMHLLSTHPMTGRGYVAHPDFDFGDSLMDRYESAAAGADRWVKGIEELLATRLDPARPTVWFVFSDHGANEHTRSRDLHGAIVRVPLIAVLPGVAPHVDDRLIDVSLDLAATVLDLAGIDPPPEYDGVSLMPLLSGLPAAAMADRIVPLGYVGDWSGAIHGRFKVLWHGDVMSLYDVVADPGETRNIVEQQPARAWAMRTVAGRELARRFQAADEARAGEAP